jgi:hypothetical protein
VVCCLEVCCLGHACRWRGKRPQREREREREASPAAAFAKSVVAGFEAFADILKQRVEEEIGREERVVTALLLYSY